MQLKMKREYESTKIGDVCYGVMVEYHGYIYIKVDKNKTGHGLALKHTRGNSVLFNPALGSLREIPGDSKVTILETVDENVSVRIVDEKDYGKYLKCGL